MTSTLPCDEVKPLPAVAWPTVAAVTLAKLAVTLPFLGRYGWHRDELYLLASSKHLQGGYVDFPAITPLVARAVTTVFGESLYALRLTALVASCASLVIAALLTRELGGGRKAQLVALVALACAPLHLGEPTLFQPNTFDMLLWASILLLTARLLRTHDVRLLPWLGLLAGVALATKWTVAWLLVGLVLGALFSRDARALARSPRLYLAIAIAALFVVPTVIWELRHDWPSIEFASNQNADTRADESRPEFLADLLLGLGVFAAPIWIAGFVHLWRDPRYRPLAAAAVFVVVAFCAGGGRSYYPFPVFVALFAAGGVAVERAAAKRKALYPLALAGGAAALLALPLAVPVLPRDTLADTPFPDIRADFGDETGWPELTDQVAAVARTSKRDRRPRLELRRGRRTRPLRAGRPATGRERPPHLSVLAARHEAGTARRRRLRRRAAAPLLHELRDPCVREIGGIDNEEVGAPIATCAPRASLATMWPGIARLV